MSRLTRAWRRKLKLLLYYQRRTAIYRLRDDVTRPSSRERVLVGISHFVPAEQMSDPEVRRQKAMRLKATVDGLMSSLAEYKMRIIVHTFENQNAVADLPEYQKLRIETKDVSAKYEPMTIPFSVHDTFFAAKSDDFDWYLFIEDDIVVHDSQFLVKIADFNRRSLDKRALLFPNRYEMHEGVKRYIDQIISKEGFAWDRITKICTDNAIFAECENPHAGLFCLNPEQLKIWRECKRDFGRVAFDSGLLECAASFSLLEAFKIYKPHPRNISYLEVEHFDQKYSILFPQNNPLYNVSAFECDSDVRS
jgi:hypothetical protein